MGKTKPRNLGAIPGLITRIAPFLLPAIMFESSLLAAVSPLPLFILTIKNYSWISVLALFTNVAALYALGGTTPSFAIGVWFFATVGILFPFLIKRFEKIIPSFWFSFLFGLSVFYIALVVVALQENRGVVEFVKLQVNFYLESFMRIPESPLLKLVEEQGRDNVYREIVNELPAAIIITYLSVFWLNLLFAARLLRGLVTKSFWATYKNPEWLVWPTLACGASFAFGKFAIYYIGLNGFKFLLALYALQGLSIISFLLNRAKTRGWLRVLIFVFAIFIAMPMVAAIGFFDQWFDFRKKFGQSL